MKGGGKALEIQGSDFFFFNIKPPACLKYKSIKASFSPISISNYSVILVISFTTIYLIVLFNTNALSSTKDGLLRGLAAVEVIWTREADQLLQPWAN